MIALEHLGFAASAGVLTFVALRGRHVRGDYGALMFTLGVASLYLVVRVHSSFSHAALPVTLALVSTYAFTALAITAFYRVSPWHPLAVYPGPCLAKLSSLWLSYVSFTGKRYEILDALHHEYGPFLRIGPNHLSINSTSAISLYNNAEKDEAYRHPDHNGHVALFFKQDFPELHRARKRVWSGFFTPASISNLIPQLERRTWELVHCIETRQAQSSDGSVNLPESLYHWSHDLTGDMVFGGCNAFELMKNGDPAGVIRTGKVALALLDSIGHTQWLRDILWHLSVTKPMHAIKQLAAQMMRVRVKSMDLPEYRDLASYLLEADIPLHELETDAIVAIIGGMKLHPHSRLSSHRMDPPGSDNTSITASLAIYFLLSHKEYYKRLRKELDEAFPDPTAPLGMEELTALPLLNGVINETLRLESPYYNPRSVPSGGITIDGKYIPEGTTVAIASHSVQTSAENFYPFPKVIRNFIPAEHVGDGQSGQDFHPERWMPEGLGPQTITNRAALGSFSYGQYNCIGKNLAYHEMRHALARLMLTFDMEFAEGFDAKAFREGILNMRTMLLKEELRIVVRRRPGKNPQQSWSARDWAMGTRSEWTKPTMRLHGWRAFAADRD
ncbi:hypothetical protein NUW54_g6625 [Trametes sanguinea]|uniref:Uncharacterized protein n=1 Tax=Trametes sanguinea TaxID=158606 RepID=A0ACC1PSW0_9APHY|nr:hypothetical protein NUW54_g6625 [Trametes sanguinea]